MTALVHDSFISKLHFRLLFTLTSGLSFLSFFIFIFFLAYLIYQIILASRFF